MKVLVCGSRSWHDYDAIYTRLSALVVEHEQVTLIHGGAVGADLLAAKAGRELGFDVLLFRSDYERYGRFWAPKARTLKMLAEEPDLVLAFQIGRSGGTQFAIDAAEQARIPVEVIKGQPKHGGTQ